MTGSQCRLLTFIPLCPPPCHPPPSMLVSPEAIQQVVRETVGRVRGLLESASEAVRAIPEIATAMRALDCLHNGRLPEPSKAGPV